MRVYVRYQGIAVLVVRFLRRRCRGLRLGIWQSFRIDYLDIIRLEAVLRSQAMLIIAVVLLPSRIWQVENGRLSNLLKGIDRTRDRHHSGRSSSGRRGYQRRTRRTHSLGRYSQWYVLQRGLRSERFQKNLRNVLFSTIAAGKNARYAWIMESRYKLVRVISLLVFRKFNSKFRIGVVARVYRFISGMRVSLWAMGRSGHLY